MPTTTPPFRADMVGSLLRTAPAQGGARQAATTAQIPPTQLKAVEDAEIRKIIAQAGGDRPAGASPTASSAAPSGTSTSSGSSTACKLVEADDGIQFKGVQTKARGACGSPASSDFPAAIRMLEHFRFLKENTTRTPKMTIPSPSMLHYPRRPEDDRARSVYPEMDAFYADLGAAYGKARQGLLRRRLPLPAARRHARSPISAIRSSARCCATAATIPTS